MANVKDFKDFSAAFAALSWTLLFSKKILMLKSK
jgi:hypothetical protein